MDGKAIKVEQANKPSFESGGKQRPQPPARNRGHLRNPRHGRGRNRRGGNRRGGNGRGGSGSAREHPSPGGHLGNVFKYKAATIGPKNSRFNCIETSQFLFHPLWAK